VNLFCLRCGETPTIDAHIFPKAVIRAFRNRGPDKKTLAVFSDCAIAAKNQNGIYDGNILCATCDGRIGVADKWFVENLEIFHSAAHARVPYETTEIALDARLAMQFAVSIIYRASLSRKAGLEGISLGYYNAIAGEISVGSNESDFNAPLVLINVLTSTRLDVRQFAFYPVRCSGSNGSYFVFTISGIQFLVKFGGRHQGISHDDVFSSALRLKSGVKTVVCCYPFDDGAEAEFLRGVKRRAQAL
jgi:hypothetical protein